MAPNLCRKTHEEFSFGGHTNEGLYDLRERKSVGKCRRNLFGHLWGNSDKNPSHPQKFACSYTYAADFLVFID